MQIGLIGGIGPAATDVYYRCLIETFAAGDTALDLTIVHADAPTLLANLAADRRTEQAALFARLTERLARAGAGCVAVTSIAGHFCRREFTAQSALPVIDMIGTVADAVASQRLDRIGILGTRTVMDSRFYGGIASAEVLAPPDAERDAVHAAYVAMAAAGTVTEAQRAVFHAAARHLIEDQRAQAIMLGGTDLALAFDSQDSDFALIDCAALHARAIARHAGCRF